ncbi:Calcium/calmodulin-dependent protein kinase type IV, partial [Irineochytrium annulatum]
MKMIEQDPDPDSERNYRTKQEAEILKEMSTICPERIIDFRYGDGLCLLSGRDLCLILCRAFYLNDERHYVLVMEKAQTTVADILFDTKAIMEPDARILIRGVLEGLKAMHDRMFVHRDIKPANLFLVDKGRMDSVKIGDFGICVPENGYHNLSGVKGTRGYMAPEVLGKGQSYGRSADMWSLGAVTYEILHGQLPFPEQQNTVGKRMFTVNQFRPKQLSFSSAYGVKISEEGWYILSLISLFLVKTLLKSSCLAARDFLTNLLTSDKEQRMTADQALNHPWITFGLDPALRQQPPPPAVIPEPVEGFDEWLCLRQTTGAAYYFHQPTGATQWHHPGTAPSPAVSPSMNDAGQPNISYSDPNLSAPHSSGANNFLSPNSTPNHSSTSLAPPMSPNSVGSRSPSPRNRVRFDDERVDVTMEREKERRSPNMPRSPTFPPGTVVGAAAQGAGVGGANGFQAPSRSASAGAIKVLPSIPVGGELAPPAEPVRPRRPSASTLEPIPAATAVAAPVKREEPPPPVTGRRPSATIPVVPERRPSATPPETERRPSVTPPETERRPSATVVPAISETPATSTPTEDKRKAGGFFSSFLSGGNKPTLATPPPEPAVVLSPATPTTLPPSPPHTHILSLDE